MLGIHNIFNFKLLSKENYERFVLFYPPVRFKRLFNVTATVEISSYHTQRVYIHVYPVVILVICYLLYI